MQDMLGTLMGGGGAAAGESKSANPVSIRHAPAPKIPQINSQDELAPAAADGDELDLD